MDSKEYKDYELKDIFDVVNSKHLHLKGRPKTIAKRQFVNCWKRDNKSLSAFDVFMALYHSEEKYDEDNEWFKQYVESNNLSIQEIKGKLPLLAPFTVANNNILFDEELGVMFKDNPVTAIEPPALNEAVCVSVFVALTVCNI